MAYTVIVVIIDEETGKRIELTETNIRYSWDVTSAAKHMAQLFEHGEVDFNEDEQN